MATVPTPTVAKWVSKYPGIVGAPKVDPLPQSATGIVAGMDPDAFNTTAQGYTATTATGKGYDPNTATGTHWKVDPNQTVQGQVDQITGKDGVLMQRAATRAKQEANARGLMNTSMAIGAGQTAVIDAAMPIAQQDASTYGSAARYNADTDNAMSTFNAGVKNDAARYGADTWNAMETFNAGSKNTAAQWSAGAKNDAAEASAGRALSASTQNLQAAVQQSQQRYDGALKTAMQNADAATRVQLQQMGDDTRGLLTQMESQYRQGLQTSQSMANTYQGLIDNISRVMLAPDLDGPAKQSAINTLTQTYNAALKQQQIISGLDLGSLLSFGGAAPTPAPTPAPAPAPAPGPAPWPGGDYRETP